MKTIFLTAGELSVPRNILRTDFWETFKKRVEGQYKIVLLVEEGKTEYYSKEFGSSDVEIEEVNIEQAGFLERVLAFFARNGLYTGTNDVMQRRAYEAGESKTPPILKRALGHVMSTSCIFQKLFRSLDLIINSDQGVRDLFNKYDPDILFSTILMNPIDIAVIREAKKRKIRTVGMVRSWDNLTTYGFLRIIPDKLFTQNEFVKENVISRHCVSEESVVVVGIPHYDLYSDDSLIKTRQKFFKKMNLDPDKKLILYAAIGDFLFQKEGEIAQVFEDLIEEGSVNYPSQVIFRAHPSFSSPLNRMKNLKHVIGDKATEIKRGDIMERSMTDGDMKHLINSLYHADLVVTAGSTMMIDAVMFDKPVITVAFDGKSKVPFWFSCARFHDYFTHIVDLLKTKGVRVVKDQNELAQSINYYLEDPNIDKVGREKIVARFAACPVGGSGKYMAEVLLTECRM